MDEVRIKVTKIKNRWHIRLYDGDRVHSEMACSNRRDINFCCRELSRWFSKLGGYSPMTEAARDRHNNYRQRPVGKIWWANTCIGPDRKI